MSYGPEVPIDGQQAQPFANLLPMVTASLRTCPVIIPIISHYYKWGGEKVVMTY